MNTASAHDANERDTTLQLKLHRCEEERYKICTAHEHTMTVAQVFDTNTFEYGAHTHIGTHTR